MVPTFKEIFGKVIEINKDEFSKILILQGGQLKQILIDSDILIGVKEGEFVNIRKQIEFLPPIGKEGGLNKLRFYVKHFTQEQGVNITFGPIKKKFENFLEIEKNYST